MKITVQTSISFVRPDHPDDHLRLHLSYERSFSHGQVFTICRRNKHHVRVDVPCPCNCRCGADMQRHPHGCGSLQACVHTDLWPYVCMDANRHASRGCGAASMSAAIGGQIRILHIKRGALPLFPHFQPIPVE